MAKNYYQRQHKPFDKSKNELQITCKSKLGTGTLDDLRRLDDFFTKLFKDNSEKLIELGVNPESLTLKIEQL